jgi:hypothetical protein
VAQFGRSADDQAKDQTAAHNGGYSRTECGLRPVTERDPISGPVSCQVRSIPWQGVYGGTEASLDGGDELLRNGVQSCGP